MRSLRVAFLLPTLAGGGAERVTVNLVDGIARRGHDVDLVLARATGPYLEHVPTNVRVVDLDASRTLAALPALVRYLRRSRPDALVTAMSHTNLVGVLATRLARVGPPVVVVEHDTLTAVTAQAVRRRARLVPRLARLLYPLADRVLAVSSGVADDLAAVTGLQRAQIDVAYNPVITPDVRAAAGRRPTHPWLRDDRRPVVLGIGRLAPKKDFASLVEAFARVAPATDARLVLLGEGPERAALEGLVAARGLTDRVDLPGFVDDPYAHLARCAVFVLSSRWEGLPTVLIEALFCGVPVVSTDCPSGPREILADGRHGRLVPVGDVDALAKGINAGLEGQLRPADEASWRPFDLDVAVERYLDVVRAVRRP